METRYFNLAEFFNYVSQGEIASDLTERQSLGRCSIADLIDFCEHQKKSNLNLPNIQLLKKLKPFIEDSTLDGIVFVANLDRETLSELLFVERNPSELWSAVATREIPPLHSVRRLTLKNTEWGMWGEHIYKEMEEFFSEKFANG